MAPTWTLPFVLSNTLQHHSQDCAPPPAPYADTLSHPDTQNTLCLPSTAPQTEERLAKARGSGIIILSLLQSFLGLRFPRGTWHRHTPVRVMVQALGSLCLTRPRVPQYYFSNSNTVGTSPGWSKHKDVWILGSLCCTFTSFKSSIPR